MPFGGAAIGLVVAAGEWLMYGAYARVTVLVGTRLMFSRTAGAA